MVTKEDLAQAILELKSSQEKISFELKQSNLRLETSQEKSDRRLDKVAKLVGNISNNQGDIAEEFFYNSFKAKPTLNNIEYDFVDKNVTRSKNKIEDEYDILLVNGKDIAIIETKYKAHSSDIEKLINTKYENFKKLYPEYKNYNHHLGLASFNINDDVKEIASKNNVILIQRKGDLIETILPSN
jgi:phage anti-repressor protein